MKGTVTSILVALVLVGGAFIFTKGSPNIDADPSNPTAEKNTDPSSNVAVVDGVQIVEIKARGGYIPRTSFAKAGIPTVLRFNTTGTFDCSSAVIIPEFRISRNLPITGTTDIELPVSKIGTLKGSCGMGMYPFEIIFQS